MRAAPTQPAVNSCKKFVRAAPAQTVPCSCLRVSGTAVSMNEARWRSRRLRLLDITYINYIQKNIPRIIESIVQNTENSIFDRCHFVQFGDSSLDFELVYYIPTNNYLRAMEAQQKVNLRIMKVFEEENISFAFPTQTLHLANNSNEL